MHVRARVSTPCWATGGTIAVTPQGRALIVHNSQAMFAGYWDGESSRAFV